MTLHNLEKQIELEGNIMMNQTYVLHFFFILSNT